MGHSHPRMSVYPTTPNCSCDRHKAIDFLLLGNCVTGANFVIFVQLDLFFSRFQDLSQTHIQQENNKANGAGKIKRVGTEKVMGWDPEETPI